MSFFSLNCHLIQHADADCFSKPTDIFIGSQIYVKKLIGARKKEGNLTSLFFEKIVIY